MKTESIPGKIWNVINPVLILFVIYFGVVYLGIFIFTSSSFAATGTLDDHMGKYFSIVAAAALVVVIIVEGIIYKRDNVLRDPSFLKNPVSVVMVVILGAAASHGLNLLFNLTGLVNLTDSYAAVENEIYGVGVVFTILRAVILAPLAEELVFRGLVFRRMRIYTGFWPAAVVSAVLFGLYHMNLLQGIFAFIFGILLSAVYDRFRNLAAPVILHLSSNLLSVILTYTNAVYPSTVICIISMVVMAAISAFLIYYLLLRKEKSRK